jgi:hypothetical protein
MPLEAGDAGDDITDCNDGWRGVGFVVVMIIQPLSPWQQKQINLGGVTAVIAHTSSYYYSTRVQKELWSVQRSTLTASSVPPQHARKCEIIELQPSKKSRVSLLAESNRSLCCRQKG